MFIGVGSHYGHSANSYETAKAVLAKASKTPKLGRPRTEKPYGFHLGMNRNHGVTWVRELEGGAIAFRLYETDVVIWHPDNSVEIENYGTVTTSSFATTFLPGGISLCHPVYKRNGEGGGHKGFHYRVAAEGSRWGHWYVCFGKYDTATFRQQGDDWVPDDDTLETVKFPELDVKGARELSKQYPLADFDNWLSMAPIHMDLEHEGCDIDECAEALEKRDFRTATAYLPLVKIPNGWGGGRHIKPLPIRCAADHAVTMGSLKKLRLALYEREGLLTPIEMKTIRTSEFSRRMARVKQLRDMDAIGYTDYGPSD